MPGLPDFLDFMGHDGVEPWRATTSTATLNCWTLCQLGEQRRLIKGGRWLGENSHAPVDFRDKEPERELADAPDKNCWPVCR